MYDWAILERTRSSKNRLKVRRFDREGLRQLQYCIVSYSIVTDNTECVMLDVVGVCLK